MINFTISQSLSMPVLSPVDLKQVLLLQFNNFIKCVIFLVTRFHKIFYHSSIF